MVQSVITAIIVTLAVLYALRKIIRFIRKPEERACSPEKCSSCAMRSPGCEETMKSGKNNTSCCS